MALIIPSLGRGESNSRKFFLKINGLFAQFVIGNEGNMSEILLNATVKSLTVLSVYTPVLVQVLGLSLC